MNYLFADSLVFKNRLGKNEQCCKTGYACSLLPAKVVLSSRTEKLRLEGEIGRDIYSTASLIIHEARPLLVGPGDLNSGPCAWQHVRFTKCATSKPH